MPKRKKQTARHSGGDTRRVNAGAVSRLADAKFAIVALGSRDLLGLRSTWDGVAERLRQYSLAEVLEVLGRISIVLNRTARPLEEEQAHIRLLFSIFGAQSRVAAGLAACIRGHTERKEVRPPFVLFHERQLITAAKAAFLTLPVDDSPGLDSLGPLGEALLMVSDLVEEEPMSPAEHNPDTEEGRRIWEQFLLANTLFHRHGIELHEIARAYSLYHMDRPHLRTAAQLRALHGGQRTLNALQFAAAPSGHCAALVTNDRRRPDVPGLRVVQFSEHT